MLKEEILMEKENEIDPENVPTESFMQKEYLDIDDFKDDLLQLNRKGITISQSDVIHILDRFEMDDEAIDAFYDWSSDADIDLIEEEDVPYAEGKNEYEEYPGSKENRRNGEIDIIRQYLKEIGKYQLLSAKEEVEIARRIEDGFLDLKNRTSDGAEAREMMITSNLRLVVSIAKKHQGRGLPFEDLVQEGNMGLMKAIDKFDYSKGFKFSTYATWWIQQSIYRAISDKSRIIRLPVHLDETINRINRTSRQLTQELNREPSYEEIASRIGDGMTAEKVSEYLKLAAPLASLDSPLKKEEEDSCLGDFVEDKGLSPEMYADNESLKEEIKKALSTLTEKEERIICLRYGLIDGRSRTLEEVGKEFGVTRERVRQIEAKALRKLKNPSISRQLQLFFKDLDN